MNLQVDHIDGDNRNNELSNLRFICLNCHSQTKTYCGRNVDRSNIERVVTRCAECDIEIDRKAILCKTCYKKKARSHIPDKDSLISVIREHDGVFVKISKVYGVTDNAIRKWCKYYGIPHHSIEMKQFLRDLDGTTK